MHIIRFLRLFRHFRDLEETADACQENNEQLMAALREEVHAHNSTKDDLERANMLLESESARRIAAESIATERRSEIDRFIDAQRELREQLQSITSERLRSVDAINLKLMETRAQEPDVDFTRFPKVATQNLRTGLVNEIRAKHRQIDAAVLAEALKGFPKRRAMNEKVGVVPSLADIDKETVT